MKALVIGATGYVGSSVCRILRQRQLTVHGLARSDVNAAQLRQAGVIPELGNLGDLAGLCDLARDFDILVFAAQIPFENEGPVLDALLKSYGGSSRTVIVTSGTGVLSIPNRNGDWDENSFAEDDPFPFTPTYNRAIRLKYENQVREASGGGLRTMVIRPPLIYGNGGSNQIPNMIESARRTGKVCYLGQGLNLYSNVHVDDLAEVYGLAIEKGVAGALYHAVAGEANFRTLAEAIAATARCETQSLTYPEACQLWGGLWVDLALATNSRSKAPRTRAELGWAPRQADVVTDIRSGSYRPLLAGGAAALKPFVWGGHSADSANS